MDIINLFNIINPCWIFLGIFLMSLVGYICWRNPYEYNTFEECVDSIGGNEGTIMIANEQVITDNLIIPANVTLSFIQGGTLNIAAGKFVTLYGYVDAGPYQIFEGDGSVTFRDGSVTEIYTQWWGAVGDGVADDTVAIQTAIDLGGGRKILFPDGDYLISATLNFISQTHLKGVGAYGYFKGSRIIATAGFGPDTMIKMDGDSNCLIENIGVYGNANVTAAAIWIKNSSNFTNIKNCYLTGAQSLILLESSYFCTFDTIRFEDPAAGGSSIHLIGTANANWFRSITIQGGKYGINIQGGVTNHFISCNIDGGLTGHAIWCRKNENWFENIYFEHWDSTITIYILGTVASPAYGNTIKDCHITGEGGTTVDLIYLRNAPATKLIGNVGYTATNFIKIRENSDDCVFIGNRKWASVTNYIVQYADSKLPHIVQPDMMGNYSDTAIPVFAKYNVSDKVWKSDVDGGETEGWVCINRQDTTMRVQAVATNTIMEVVATAGILAGDIIGIVLDNDVIHNSTVASITDADTLVIDDAIPGGRTAEVGDDVFTNRWNTFGNVSLEGSLVWDPANLIDGAGETSGAITVTGAAIGDSVMVYPPYDMQDCLVYGYVQAANTVEIRIQNESTGARNFGSAIWKVKVLKY